MICFTPDQLTAINRVTYTFTKKIRPHLRIHEARRRRAEETQLLRSGIVPNLMRPATVTTHAGEIVGVWFAYDQACAVTCNARTPYRQA